MPQGTGNGSRKDSSAKKGDRQFRHHTFRQRPIKGSPPSKSNGIFYRRVPRFGIELLSQKEFPGSTRNRPRMASRPSNMRNPI